MRILSRVWKKITKESPSDPPEASTQRRGPTPRKPSARLEWDTMHSQLQSPLFAKLSAELRILIYAATLGDPLRPMHIVPYRTYRNAPYKVGHLRCEDTQSPFPTWQHECFGWLARDGATRRRVGPPRTTDGLLSLPLTCRLIYSEALELLYAENTFDFRGAQGLFRLKRMVQPIQFHAIHRVHISTFFLAPMRWHPNETIFPPENYKRWPEACRVLQDMPALHLIRLDFVVRIDSARSPLVAVDDESLLAIYMPLKDITARVFEIETNVEIPHSVRRALGPTNFAITVKETPLDQRLLLVRI